MMSSPAILEEIKTGGRIGFSSDLMAVPCGAPEVTGHNVSKEFEVSNGEGLEVGRRGTGDEFVVGKIENSNTWEAFIPPVRAGVLCDVGGGGKLEERDAIAKLDGLNPPVDVLKEGGVENDIEAGRGGATFCCEDTVEEETARGDDACGVHEAAGERTQFFFGGGLLGGPGVQRLEQGGDFVGGKGDGVCFQIILQKAVQQEDGGTKWSGCGIG